MTEITAEFDRQTGHCRIAAKGHATGSDKVCAAISGLLFALAGYAENRRLTPGVQVWTMRLEKGDAVIDYTGDQEAVGAFLAVAVGLLQIARDNPVEACMRVKEETFFSRTKK